VNINGNQLRDVLQSVFTESVITGGERFPAQRNMTYHVYTRDSSFVAKIAPIWERSALDWEYEVMQQWYSSHGAVAKPIREAEVVMNQIEYCIKAYSYIEGHEIKLTVQSAYEFGQSLAMLHSAWQGGRSKAEMNHPTRVIDTEHLVRSLNQIEMQCCEFQDVHMIRRYTEQIGDFLEENKREEYFCMNHGDAHFKNTRRQKDGTIVWFDFEDAAWQWRTYDIATAIWGTYGSGGNSYIWNSIVEGYCSIHELQDQEYCLVNYLIFARHLWWLGMNAEHWEQWKLPYTKRFFFRNGLELLVEIAQVMCELK